MGKIFRYIADSALEIDDLSNLCDICNNEPAYPYQGIWVNQEKREEVEIYRACEECIKNESLKWMPEFELMDSFGASYIQTEVNKHIDWKEGETHRKFWPRYSKEPIWEGKALTFLNKLRKTPTIPMFIQKNDWVVCCDDLCEFQGNPKDYEQLVEIQEHATYWDHGEGPFSYQRDFIEGGEPLLYNEISVFNCFHCNRQYWIDQF